MNLVDFPITVPGTNLSATVPLTYDDPQDGGLPASQRRQLALTPADFTELTTRVRGLDLYVYGPGGDLATRIPLLHLTKVASQLSFVALPQGGYAVRAESAQSDTKTLPARCTYVLFMTEPRPGHPLGDFVFPFCGGSFPVGNGVGAGGV